MRFKIFFKNLAMLFVTNKMESTAAAAAVAAKSLHSCPTLCDPKD